MTFNFLKKPNIEKIKIALKKKFLFLVSLSTLSASLVAFVLGQIALSLLTFVLLIIYYGFYIYKAKTKNTDKNELKVTKKSLIISLTTALIFGLVNFYPLKPEERNALLFFSFLLFIFVFLITQIIKNYRKNRKILQTIADFEKSQKNDKK